MIFNSSIFLVFFLLFFPLYWLINNKNSTTIRNAFTILASYLFYGWWDWRFLSLIIVSSITDYLIGLQLGKTHPDSYRDQRRRKWLLICSIGVNLGILGFFKYFNFFIESLEEIVSLFSLQLNWRTLQVILPVGISFYTFQTMSYTIDIYRRKLKPTKDPFAFFAFVSFFPQLVAGPIERASHLLGQFQEKKIFNYQQGLSGLRLVLWGLFKKIVIADNFGLLADLFFQPETPVSGLNTLLGALCFAFQIYADFSGYSDIAIGLSKMLGYNLRKNFQTPYFARSFGEFWHRWHISLSTWFRDYVYIPLGGNRGNRGRVALNIWITFLLSGLWHGAQITFVIWGALHGLVLILERWSTIRMYRCLSTTLVFITVVLLWIPFRAENFGHLMELIGSIGQFTTYSLDHVYPILSDYPGKRLIALILITIIYFPIEHRMSLLDFSEWISQKSKAMRWTTYYLLIVAILFLGNFAVKPYFIYFQF